MTNEELAEINAAFAIECSENLAEIESALLVLETRPEVNQHFNSLFRAVHTIKGSSSIVGADTVEQFCHEMENLLSRVREHEIGIDAGMIVLFLQCHDHIRSLISQFEANEDTPPPLAHANLLSRISQRLQTTTISLETKTALQEPLQTDTDLTDNSATSKFVRIDAQKLDQLINLVVELVTASSSLEATVKSTSHPGSIEASSAVSLLVKQVQEKSMGFRMVPINDLFKRFQRILHDMASESGKKAQLVISGGDTELDKVVAEKLKDPLVHLVRNAIDHGVEAPDERTAAGKPPVGIIHLSAFQEAGAIVICIEDDGRGLNRDRILQRALETGLIRPDELASRDPLALIFEPGFSTLDQATLLSGRGVGMDVVKRKIDELQGKIEISSLEEKGTTVRLRIPLSLALIDGFMVMVDEKPLIMPMELVEETIDLPQAALTELNAHGYLPLRGEALSCMDLRQFTQRGTVAPLSRFAVVVKNNGKRVGLIVDQLVGETKAVIKPLGRTYRNIKAIAGASILGDGSIALILDLQELIAQLNFKP
jgi:two-component system chemotaxis sensor kinase CheA